MIRYVPFLSVLPVLLLAGCWQSGGSLYGGEKPLQPFRAGQLESRNSENPPEKGRAMLTLERDGFYRLTNNDRADSDYGEYFHLRFFALGGAPAGTLVYEAFEPCKPDDKSCTPAGAPRYYGLARTTPEGAEITNPPCPKDGAPARLPGVTADSYGTCIFSDRVTLEKALRQLARTKWKTDVTYRFTNPAR